MSKTNFDRERESEISCNSNDESSEGSYQNYRRGSLPKGYTPYKETRQVNENEYDGYDPNYEGAETPNRDKNEKTCCDIGRLSFLTVYSMLESVITEQNFLKNFFQRNKPFKGISLAKSEEYSSNATNLFFNDPESNRAKRFQDSNSILIYNKLLITK